jgi:hypothetical protein
MTSFLNYMATFQGFSLVRVGVCVDDYTRLRARYIKDYGTSTILYTWRVPDQQTALQNKRAFNAVFQLEHDSGELFSKTRIEDMVDFASRSAEGSKVVHTYVDGKWIPEHKSENPKKRKKSTA